MVQRYVHIDVDPKTIQRIQERVELVDPSMKETSTKYAMLLHCLN